MVPWQIPHSKAGIVWINFWCKCDQEIIVGKNMSHRIHVWHIYLYIYHKSQLNVGIMYVNIPYVDPMGVVFLGV